LGRKYAKWKAAYIHNCLKSGQTPVAGPLATGEDQEDEEQGMDQEQGQFLLEILVYQCWCDPERHPGPAAPGPDPFPFQPTCRGIFVFPDKFNILSKILKKI
jgi:hypothetical protein